MNALKKHTTVFGLFLIALFFFQNSLAQTTFTDNEMSCMMLSDRICKNQSEYTFCDYKGYLLILQNDEGKYAACDIMGNCSKFSFDTVEELLQSRKWRKLNKKIGLQGSLYAQKEKNLFALRDDIAFERMLEKMRITRRAKFAGSKSFRRNSARLMVVEIDGLMGIMDEECNWLLENRYRSIMEGDDDKFVHDWFLVQTLENAAKDYSHVSYTGKLLHTSKDIEPYIDSEGKYCYRRLSDNKRFYFGEAYNDSLSLVSFLTSFIELNMRYWNRKWEFESIEEYRERIEPEFSEKAVNYFANRALKIYNGIGLAGFKTFTLEDYDKDNSCFLVRSDVGNIPIHVDLEYAVAFRNAFSSAFFYPDNVRFAYDGNKLVMVSLSKELDGTLYHGSDELAYSSYENGNGNDRVLVNIKCNDVPYSSKVQTQLVKSDVDRNIPIAYSENCNTFAFIIGNELYRSVAPVDYAANDADVFAKYCKKTLGLPEENVRVYSNSTYAIMHKTVEDVKSISDVCGGDINVIFYYAGHGIPDSDTFDSYLLPVDADGSNTALCYPVDRLYEELGKAEANNVFVFLDACFSGSLRGDGMLDETRDIGIKAKSAEPQGNMVVFTASSGNETAFPYKEQGHGMFTYFLLKKLQESNGNCTLGELADYIYANVPRRSKLMNDRIQRPTVTASPSICEAWRDFKFK